MKISNYKNFLNEAKLVDLNVGDIIKITARVRPANNNIYLLNKLIIN